ncbi:MAG: hypothetical protein F6K42_19000 [Leptolyngbya sp. SIO1D8]|nr:hypothetical protein [Leptolyngbya sp. SIO1D8]
MSGNLSIRIVAIAQFVVSGLSLVTGVLLGLLASGQLHIFSQDLTSMPLYLKGLIVLGLAISLLGLIASYGLWTLKRWGWVGSLLFQGLCIANNGLALLAGQSLSAGLYFSVMLCVGFMGVLCLPSVRRVFFPVTPAPIP